MNEKLKPCPFCKSCKICCDVSYTFSVKFYQIRCENCGFRTGYVALKRAAIARWDDEYGVVIGNDKN